MTTGLAMEAMEGMLALVLVLVLVLELDEDIFVRERR